MNTDHLPPGIVPVQAIARIHTGYPFRQGILPTTGGLRLIQMRNIGENNRIRYHELTCVAADSIPSSYDLAPGDVLFRARGEYNLATVFRPHSGDSARYIAAGHLLVLRPDRQRVLPEYLAWYINQPPFQRQLARAAAGTNIKAVTKTRLGALTVQVPDLDTQDHVVRLSALAVREAELLDRLKDSRLQLANCTALQAVARRLTEQ